MKNNYLYKAGKKPFFVLGNCKRPVCIIGLMLGLFTCQEVEAQFVNTGDVKVSKNALLSVYMDYDNESSGNFINDGEVYIFNNWANNGTVSYSNSSLGKTFFAGSQEQLIVGSKIANFQNIIFNNLTSLVPFQLKTTIAVGDNTDFKNGIINAAEFNGKMIFNENASHSNVGNQSFVDGMVEKKGDVAFQFPVGDELYFRPSYHAAGSSVQNAYTTQYFFQNSNDLYPHSSKDETIVTINDAEYWKITQDNGEENIVLSLTLNSDTTPSAFFNENPDTQLAIVRWDASLSKWINDGGEVSDPASTENFSKLLTAQVGGYGIFTMAIVKKVKPEPDDLIVYNAVSPNGDGINDTFHIKGIAKYPDNTVEIYNRWGVKVYDAKSYNESDIMFGGYSDGRVTVKRGDKLPTGTYFYILKYNNGVKGIQKSGYLYINNN
ncbi:gliding motility-associated C-terminal domain-containing protein [Flavobacterium pectinovorum]|uniref:Gliding motility-associated C-terminal domain-containing protein n=1 Tax=Flavobacterium pectinovorum TaxID=29533 RepID=A0AB36NVK1_9FLAO|nr:gliding motility-associated C-terminal domain-containing protein [Flavobacterium pectinovorum]OXA99251.1 hypothetical protein B0A72_22720 [Flavobacterium pectinovorum]SHN21993.1 gliding motility-associated C-terminal domain-containing protein [Flavobacterium pectinovorum]